ncbi:MAG TPA: GNAT family N-acetyltransferase [Candidatus Sulfotelmatobacter sp.]|jgi:CelD/BcsL family acetyltransferase involved in cellulose biosynthesis
MRLVVLDEIPEDDGLRRQWNALALQMQRPQVFYTYDWSLAVQRAYRQTLHPLIFLAHDDRSHDNKNSLIGIAALATDGKAHASFLCATTGDYCDFLSSTEHRPAFIAAVLADLRRRNVEKVTLTNLPADSPTVSALQRDAAESGYRSFARTAYICTQVALDRLERRPADNKPVLPGKKMVRRSLAAMGKESPVRLEHARSWDEISPILPQFVEAHIARFEATGRVSNLAQPERRRFLEELTKQLSPYGWVVLTRMMSGDRVLAWNYGFVFEGVWFWYQPTFDSALEKYSPGFCLLSKLVEDAAENPELRAVDLGLGAEEYKDRFANQTRETLYVTLRASAVQHVREIVRYRAAEIVKASPRVEAAARALLKRVRRPPKSPSQNAMPGKESI